MMSLSIRSISGKKWAYLKMYQVIIPGAELGGERRHRHRGGQSAGRHHDPRHVARPQPQPRVHSSRRRVASRVDEAGAETRGQERDQDDHPAPGKPLGVIPVTLRAYN